jgi:hypothetical protein
MRISNGGISIEYLESIPIDKYLILRKAAEIEEIAHRRVVISDLNAAFSGNKEATDALLKAYHELTEGEEMLRNDKSDHDWEKKLGKFAKGTITKQVRKTPFAR